MLQRHELLRQLRDVLATLFSDQDSATRVVEDVGLRPERIAHSLVMVNTWHNILKEAEKQGCVAQLLAAALREYPTNQDLIDARQAYDDWRASVPGFRDDAATGAMPKPSHIPGALPPLRSTMIASAPSPPRPFVGRHEYLEVLTSELMAGNAIASLGVGGIGKTATAQKLAADQSPHCPGGVFWGSLQAHGGNAHAILREWARICGQDLSDEADLHVLADLVRGILAARKSEAGPLLAIIDDVRTEWLGAAQALKQAIPAGAPLLLTTHDPKLAASLEARIHSLGLMSIDESLELLKARAGSAVVEAEAAEAQALLERIGGLPLAVRLAGDALAVRARKPGYSPLQALRRDVDEHAAEPLMLTGELGGLAGAFAVSYRTLPARPADTQRVFRWLAAFASSTLKVTSVAAVVGLSETDTMASLDRMVWLSLLDWDDRTGRYMMHPLVHQYARSLLVEADEANEAEQKHLEYYLSFARAHEQQEPISWDSLEEERPNLLVAAGRAAEIKSSAALVTFEEALLHESQFLYVRGYYREAVDLLGKSLAVQVSTGEQQNLARTLNKLAFFNLRLGQYDSAQEYVERAHSLAIAANDEEQQADSLHYRGMISDTRGENALDQFERELEIRRRLPKPLRLANCLNSLAIICESLARYPEAKRYYGEALSIFSALDDEQGRARCTGNRGIVSLKTGDYASAMDDFEEALKQSEAMHYQEGVAQNLLNRGVLQCYLDEYALSLRSLEESLTLWRGMGDKAGQALVLVHQAEVYGILGDYERAVSSLQAAQELLREVGDRSVELEYLSTLGSICHGQGNHEEALRVFSELGGLADVTGSKYFVVQSKLGLSQTCIALSGEQNLQRARCYTEAARDLCQQLHLAGHEPRAHTYLGKSNLLLGDQETALQNCRQAMRLLSQRKHVPGSGVGIYLIAIEILAATGAEDERRQCLESAFGLVEATACRIQDPTLRERYLAVRVIRQILDDWERESATGTGQH